MERVFAVGLGGLALALLGLSISSHGLLINAWRHRYSPEGQEVLTCSYLSGSGVMAVDFWHSPTGLFGQATCPLLHDLSHDDFSQPLFGYEAGAG